MTILDQPKTFERGTSPQRHPWFLRIGDAAPPRPPTNGKTYSGEPSEPDPDNCPSCNTIRAGVCRCGYDWDNWAWTDKREEHR